MTATLAALLMLLSADPLPCKGQKPGDKKIETLRKTLEGGEMYKLAVAMLGAPTSCSAEWSKIVLGVVSEVDYQLPKGTLSYNNLPEQSIVTLQAADGQALDEAKVLAYLHSDANAQLFRINWKKQKPKVSEDHGVRTEAYWTPGEDEGSHGFELSRKGGKLVTVKLSIWL
jgi:hypothetical protein